MGEKSQKKLDIMPKNANFKSAHWDKVTVIVRKITLNFLTWVQLDNLFKMQNIMYLIKLNPIRVPISKCTPRAM